MVMGGTRSPQINSTKARSGRRDVGRPSEVEKFRVPQSTSDMNFPAAAAALRDLLVNAGFQWSQTTAPSSLLLGFYISISLTHIS